VLVQHRAEKYHSQSAGVYAKLLEQITAITPILQQLTSCCCCGRPGCATANSGSVGCPRLPSCAARSGGPAVAVLADSCRPAHSAQL
jgi:hypothetical protein